MSNSVNSIKDLFFVPSYFPSIPFACLLSPSLHTCCSALSLVPAAHSSLPFFFSSPPPHLIAFFPSALNFPHISEVKRKQWISTLDSKRRKKNRQEKSIVLIMLLLKYAFQKQLCHPLVKLSYQTTETHGTYKPHYRHVTPTEFKHLKIVVHLFYSLEKLISVLLPNSNEQMNKGEDYFILRCYCHLTFSMFQFVIA